MVSSNSGRITFGGVASGIDTNSIISQLMAIEQRPINALQRRVSDVQTSIQAYAQLTSAISALMTAAAPLSTPTTYTQRSASVSGQTVDANKISASASAGAALQSFTFEAVSKATPTTVISPTALGSPVSADDPLDEAGFGAIFKAGTFSINGQTFTIPAATASTYESGAATGTSVSTTAPLASAGLDVAPTTGSIVINGHTIAFDADDDSLSDVITRINAAGAGVTASFDASARTLTLTSSETGPGAISIADADGGTFFQSMNMLDGGGGNVGVITDGTDLISLNDVIDDINNAGIGVTATLVNDAQGNPNLLELSSGADVQIGSGGDTSNFFTVTGLSQSPSGSTRTSVFALGQVQPSLNLEDARFATALTASTGTFTVNGVDIEWDATKDSLQNVITRINSSGAGVTATFDAFSNKMVLTSTTTGGSAISLADGAGDFLTSTGLLGTTQTMGTNATYKIDNGPLRYSTSNVITDAVAGLTLTVNDIPTEAVTVSVNLATQGVQTAVSTFVSTFNQTTTLIRNLTAYDPAGLNAGVLFGNATAQRLEPDLRSKLTGFQNGLPGGLRSLSDVGFSFGAVGSAVGTTNTLAVDAAKLNTALQADPDAVGKLFTAFTAAASLDGGGTGSVASISGTPTNATKAGRYAITTDALGSVEVSFQGNDGSAPLVTTGSLVAGEDNTTLIPGMTITATTPITAGIDYITLVGAPQGFGKTLSDYLKLLASPSGLLATGSDGLQSQVIDMNKQIAVMTNRLTARQNQLTSKFNAMEQVIQSMQAQGQQLTSIFAQLQKPPSS